MGERPHTGRILVAVYGTLKEGCENWRRYLNGRTPDWALFVELPFEMYANDEYPMLVPATRGERQRIWIEVFAVDENELRQLDALEAPYGYWRESVFVSEIEREVEIYLHSSPAPPGFNHIPSGKWVE